MANHAYAGVFQVFLNGICDFQARGEENSLGNLLKCTPASKPATSSSVVESWDRPAPKGWM